MLSFEHKKSIFRSFSQLQEKPISKGRINYVYPESRQRGKILITQLSSSGNGYVNGKYMDGKIIKEKGYQVDPRGWICIKDFSEEQLREVVEIAMMSMSGKEETERAHSDDSGNETEWQEISDQTYFEQLVRSCLYNWLGYGNINAPVWFLGIEEGGAEIWRNKRKRWKKVYAFAPRFVCKWIFVMCGKICTTSLYRHLQVLTFGIIWPHFFCN